MAVLMHVSADNSHVEFRNAYERFVQSERNLFQVSLEVVAMSTWLDTGPYCLEGLECQPILFPFSDQRLDDLVCLYYEIS